MGIDMTDDLELDSDSVFDRLIALIAISSPEVALTMKDGSVKRVSLDADKILAELQEAKSLVEKAERLEKEADWLAQSAGDVIMRCAGHRACDKDTTLTCAKCWREAARKAVEEKLAPEEQDNGDN